MVDTVMPVHHSTSHILTNALYCQILDMQDVTDSYMVGCVLFAIVINETKYLGKKLFTSCCPRIYTTIKYFFIIYKILIFFCYLLYRLNFYRAAMREQRLTELPLPTSYQFVMDLSK